MDFLQTFVIHKVHTQMAILLPNHFAFRGRPSNEPPDDDIVLSMAQGSRKEYLQLDWFDQLLV